MIASSLVATMSQPLTLTSLPLFPLASMLFPGGVLALREGGNSIVETAKLAGCSASQVKRVCAMSKIDIAPAHGRRPAQAGNI